MAGLQAKVHTQPVLFAKVWQHPYVDVVRQLGVLEGKHSKSVGDVRVMLDPALNKQVLAIKGAVSAANYLELPGPGTTQRERTRNPAAARCTSLGLTGEYVYMQLRAMAERYFVIHLDVLTTQGLVIRLSISNIFKGVKLTNHGRVLQLPCDFLSTRWTILALHLPSLLEECSNNVQSMAASTTGETGGSNGGLKYVYASLHRVQFCSSLFVRNLLTSSHRYSISTFPKDARFFVPRNSSFDEHYEFFWIVTPPEKGAARRAQGRAEEEMNEQRQREEEEEQQEEQEREAAEAQQREREQEALRRAGQSHAITANPQPGPADSQQRLWGPRDRQPTTPLRASVPVLVPSGVSVHPSADSRAASQSSRSTSGVAATLASPNRPLSAAEFDEQPRPDDDDGIHDGRAAAPSSLAQAALRGEAGAQADPSVPTHSPMQRRQAWAMGEEDRREMERPDQADEEEEEQEEDEADADFHEGKHDALQRAGRVVRHASASTASASAASPASESPLSPDPVLSLSSIVGFTPSRSCSNVCWSPCGQFMLYPSNHVLVVAHVKTGKQEFLTGHTGEINLVYVASNGIVATGQRGKCPLIRLWDFSTRRCVAILMAHASDLKSLCFSYMNLMFGAVGRDAQGRLLIVIWDISALATTGRVHIVAKQLSDYPISHLYFSPFRADPLSMVSVGHESVRFWRIKTRHLPGASLALNEHARNTFTALAFEAKYGETDQSSKRMYVATAAGSLFQINYHTRQLECIYKLHSGPIYSLAINEGFCVTGSGDAFLRVWPLDFSDFYLQAQHKGAITSVSMSSDGLAVLVGSENGCVGVLDLASTAYQTKVRSHLDTVYAVAFDPHRAEFATGSADGTIRIFGVHTLEQIYEFYSPHESILCLAYHPSPGEYRLACGFASGSMRVMDIASTSMHVDYAQHTGRVTDVLFSPDGGFLYSSGEDGNVCAYDVSKNYLPVRMFTTYRNQPVPLPPSVLRSLQSGGDRTDRSSLSSSRRGGGADPDARVPFISHHLDRAREEAHALDNPVAPLPGHSHSHARHCLGGSEAGGAHGYSADRNAPPPLPPHTLALSADGTLLATIGAEPTSIVLLATDTLRQVRLLSTHSLPVAKLLFPPPTIGPNGAAAAAELVAVLADSSFQRFALADGALLAHVSTTPSLKPRQERLGGTGVSNIAFHGTAASAAAAAGGPVCTSACMSPLGLFLLTGTNDPLLRVWDFHSRPHAPHFQSLLAHQQSRHPNEGITALTFSPEGSTLVSTGGDAVWVWQLLADEAALLEQRARRARRANDTRLLAQAQGRDQEEANGRVPAQLYSASASMAGHGSAGAGSSPFREHMRKSAIMTAHVLGAHAGTQSQQPQAV